MRVLLSAMGRAALLAGLPAFLILIQGVWVAPNLKEAGAIAGSASIALGVAAIRALFVFVPRLSEAITKLLGLPPSWEHVVIGILVAAIGGFLSILVNFLTAPDMNSAKAAAMAGMLAIGTAITSILSGLFTPGQSPAPNTGFDVPPQPVPPEALPTPRADVVVEDKKAA